MSVYTVSAGVSRVGTLCDGVKAVLDAAVADDDLPDTSVIVVRMLPTVSYTSVPRFTVSPVGIKTEQTDRTWETTRTITIHVSLTQEIEFGDDDAATTRYRQAIEYVEIAEQWLAAVEKIKDGTHTWNREEIDTIPGRAPLSAEGADQWSQFTGLIQLSFIESTDD